MYGSLVESWYVDVIPASPSNPIGGRAAARPWSTKGKLHVAACSMEGEPFSMGIIRWDHGFVFVLTAFLKRFNLFISAGRHALKKEQINPQNRRNHTHIQIIY